MQDNEIIERIHKDHHELICAIANKYAWNRDEADDLVQQVYLRMLETVHRWPREYDCLPKWVAVVARYTCTNQLRSRYSQDSKQERKARDLSKQVLSRAAKQEPSMLELRDELARIYRKLRSRLHRRTVRIVIAHLSGAKTQAELRQQYGFTSKGVVSDMCKRARKAVECWKEDNA